MIANRFHFVFISDEFGNSCVEHFETYWSQLAVSATVMASEKPMVSSLVNVIQGEGKRTVEWSHQKSPWEEIRLKLENK